MLLLLLLLMVMVVVVVLGLVLRFVVDICHFPINTSACLPVSSLPISPPVNKALCVCSVWPSRNLFTHRPRAITSCTAHTCFTATL